MTESPQRAQMEFESMDEVLAIMRGNGHRVSAACRVVLEALFKADGPASAQFIADGLAGQTVALEVSSVYRNLERLEELGVVRHVHLGHGPGLYMLVGSGEKEFLACERCGRVRSLDPGELDSIRKEIEERFGYRAMFGHFPIIGLCKSCAAASGESRSAKRANPDVASAGEHSHEHSHGDYVHSHPHAHVHEKGLEHAHVHEHDG